MSHLVYFIGGPLDLSCRREPYDAPRPSLRIAEIKGLSAMNPLKVEIKYANYRVIEVPVMAGVVDRDRVFAAVFAGWDE